MMKLPFLHHHHQHGEPHTHTHKARGVRRTDEETPAAFAFLKITVGRETSALVSFL
jgi:hypothetical protein